MNKDATNIDNFDDATYEDLYLPGGRNVTNPCYRKKDCQIADEILRQIFPDGVNNKCETINPCYQQTCNIYQKVVVMTYSLKVLQCYSLTRFYTTMAVVAVGKVFDVFDTHRHTQLT